MSFEDSAATLDLKLAPSLRALGVVMAVHVAAAAMLFIAQPQKFVMLGLAALMLASWFSLRRHSAFGFGPRALRRLIAHGDGSWTAETPRLSERAELLPGAFIHAGLIVIRFKTADGATRSRALFGDESPPEQLRRLRARILLATPAPDRAGK